MLQNRFLSFIFQIVFTKLICKDASEILEKFTFNFGGNCRSQ